jgi:hypothetical protein
VRPDRATVGTGDRHHVGEVVLPLGVVVGDPGQRVDEEPSVEGEDAAVDLAHRRLLRRRLLLLDDRGHRPVLAAQHPAVAERVVDIGGEHGDGSAPLLVLEVVRDEPAERLALEQGGVTGHHDDHPVRRTGGSGERLQGDPDRVAGALLSLLDGEQRTRHLVQDVRPDLLAAVADHRDQVLRVDVQRSGEHVADHAAAAQLVEHLHPLRLHPGPAAGRQDDDRRGSGPVGGGFGHGGSCSVRVW